jgi:RNA binding exosome subunit
MSINRKKTVILLQVSLIVHATEDVTKVIRAVKNVIPGTSSENHSFTQTPLQGYYKNPIIRLETSLSEQTMANASLKHLLQTLDKNDRSHLALMLEDFIDAKKNLFLRFNKQDAFLGKTSLCTSDPIHIKIKLNFHPMSFADLEAVLQGEA